MLSHEKKPTKVLPLSTSNLVAPLKPDTRSLHPNLLAKGSEVRGTEDGLCRYARSLQSEKENTAGKAMGNHPGYAF